MPNKYHRLSISADEKIQLLTNALAREKIARQLLESKIEKLNENNFSETKELLTSYESARIRQNQLEFLSFLNRENIQYKNVNELTQFFVENVLELLGQYTSIIYHYDSDEVGDVHFIQKYQASWQLMPLSEHVRKLLCDLIPQNSSQWIRTALSDDEKTLLPFMQEPLLLSLKIPQHKLSDIIIIINLEHYCYSDDFKNTIDIAANQLTEIVQKRAADKMLSTNYSKLQETVSLLKKTQQQLTHNEKMVSLGQLAAGVAHEINNPLSYLSSNLETLQDYLEQFGGFTDYCIKHNTFKDLDLSQISYLREDSKDLLKACLNGINRMSEIIINLKQFSRKGTNEFVPTNLQDVLNDSLAVVSNKIKYDYEVVITHHSKHLFVEGNFGQLQQVFVNLFINAMDAMSENGELSIETKRDGNHIIIVVKDNGIGMEGETANRIFEPFFTTKENSNGTGLGLSVSYAIITKHNATISVHSQVNEGTTFTLKFPSIDSL